MSLVADIARMQAPPFWIFSAVATALSLFGLVSGFRSVRRARLIEDAPSARVRSAHQGYVELNGVAKAMDGEPVVAPLSAVHCCWYRFKVEERRNDKWQTTRKGESADLFLLRDATGECVVDPEGAEITVRNKETWYGDGSSVGMPGLHRTVPDACLAGRLAVLGIQVAASPLSAVSPYRYTEEVILAGDPLYAIGHFKTLDDIDHRSHRDELTAQILRDWKQRPETLRERFDQDRDGVVDAAEWERARRAAALRAAEEYAAQAAGQQLHMLSRPAARDLPYLISNVAEFALVRRYRWRGAGGLLLFFLGGAAATLLLTARFTGV